MTPHLDLVRRALTLYTERLIALPNVVGVGIGERPSPDPARSAPEPCLAVYVTRKLPRAALADHERVPRTLPVQGVRVRTLVVETGAFEPQQEPRP